MFRDDDSLFEEFTTAARKPQPRNQPPRSYSPRYDKRRKTDGAPGARRRRKGTLV